MRFYARVEEEDGEFRCVRYRLLLLPPSADVTERILQRLPQVRNTTWLSEHDWHNRYGCTAMRMQTPCSLQSHISK